MLVLGEWDGYYGVEVYRADRGGRVTLHDLQFEDLFPTICNDKAFDVQYFSQGIYCYKPEDSCQCLPTTPDGRPRTVQNALDLTEVDPKFMNFKVHYDHGHCLLYTSPSPRD